jgi:hypothetical protein
MPSLDPTLAKRIKAMPLEKRKALRKSVKAKLDQKYPPKMKAPPGAK